MHLIKYRRTAVVVIPMFIKKTARKLVKIYNNSNIVIADISPYKLPGTAKLFEVLFLSKGAIFLCEAADIVSKTFAFHNKY